MYFLCNYSDLNDHPVKILRLEQHPNAESVIVLKHREQVYAYVNRCPHAWVHLDSVDDNIISACGMYLQCSSHFAQFRFEDGRCIFGPCQGMSLQALPVQIKQDRVFIS